MHIWKSVTNVTEVVADGYNVLLNVGYDAKSWYLDNLNVKVCECVCACECVYGIYRIAISFV